MDKGCINRIRISQKHDLGNSFLIFKYKGIQILKVKLNGISGDYALHVKFFLADELLISFIKEKSVLFPAKGTVDLKMNYSTGPELRRHKYKTSFQYSRLKAV